MIHTNAGRAVVAPSTMASVASAAVTALEPAGPTGSTRLRRSRADAGSSPTGYSTIPTPSYARYSITMNGTGRIWGVSKKRSKFCWTR